MKRAFTSLSAAVVALGIVGAAAAAPVSKVAPKPVHGATSARDKDVPKLSKWQRYVAHMLKVSAPGDEYFGRMKMSYLGINNTFHDEMIRAGAYTTDPGIISNINFADEALNAWARKYPDDPQLARSYFLAFEMYRKIWVQTYQDKAWQYAHIVIRKWPTSFFGKALSKDLQIGFTEHYFAKPLPCPALPSSTASPGKRAIPTPSPSPVPVPTASPTPRPGMPPADVLPVPCIAPTPIPTAAPSPTPLPSLSPESIPSGSLMPSPMPSATPAPVASATPKP